MSNLQIDHQWSDCTFGSPEERATFGDLLLALNQVALTKAEQNPLQGEHRGIIDRVRVSGFPLAQWLLSNWYRILYEPEKNSLEWQLSHQLRAIGGGFVWPNITFCSDGSALSIAAQADAPMQGESTGERVRFINSLTASVPIADFAQTMLSYASAVDARLTEKRVLCNDFSDALAILLEERADADTIEWRKIEALFGYDIDDAPEALMGNASQLMKNTGVHAVEELVAAFQSDYQEKYKNLKAASAGRISVQMPDVADLCHGDSSNTEPWREAKISAEAVRERLGLGGGPISNKHLADIFNCRVADITSLGSVDFGASVAFRESDRHYSVVVDKSPLTGKRFTLSRLLSDYLMEQNSPTERLLPATRAKTRKQKFQRAFAQEFLCPHLAILNFAGTEHPDQDAIEAAAEHFQVSTWAVVNTLVNNGTAPREMRAAFGIFS